MFYEPFFLPASAIVICTLVIFLVCYFKVISSSNHFKDPPVVEEIRRALADFDFGDNVPVDQLRKAKMSSTLLNMLITGFHSDFDVFVKERRIQIHKSVVAIQSDFFAALFKEPIDQEMIRGRLNLPENFEDVFQLFRFDQFSQCMYGERIPVDLETVKRLLVLANQFQANELRTKFEMRLIAKLGTNNAFSLLIFAHHNKADKLKAFAMKLIAERRPNEFTESKEYIDIFKTLPLSNELLRECDRRAMMRVGIM